MSHVDTIYIIDDDEDYTFLTRIVIEGTELVERIQVFTNGQEAIDFIENLRRDPEKLPDIILLDLNMPIMDGWQFLGEYIALKPKLAKSITIFIVSSSIDPADVERARQFSEVSDFIVKPISRARFHEMIRSVRPL